MVDEAPVALPESPAEPRKSNTTLIIILVVVVLVLCCCISTVATSAFIYFANQDTGSEYGDGPTYYDPLDDSLSVEERALKEWESWEPPPGDFAYTALTPRQQAVAEEIMAELYPGLGLREIYMHPGDRSEEGQPEKADVYVFSAYPVDNRDVDIAGFFYAPSEEHEESGETLNPDSVYEGHELMTLEGGMQYVVPTYKVPLRHDITAEMESLLIAAGEDWPDGVITEVYLSEDESTAFVTVSTWDHYISSGGRYGGVEATYVLEEDAWVLLEYNWSIPDVE